MKIFIVNIFIVSAFFLQSYEYTIDIWDLIILNGLAIMLVVLNLLFVYNMFLKRVDYRTVVIFTILLSLLMVLLGLFYNFHFWIVYTNAIFLAGMSIAIVLYNNKKKQKDSQVL